MNSTTDRIGFLVLAALVLTTLAPAFAAQAQVRWETSLDGALDRARREKKPLLVSMHTSTEIGCRRMLEKVYRDPEVAAALEDFVLLPTCFDEHEETKVLVEGEEVSVSPLFGTVDCATLMQNEMDVRRTYFDGPIVEVPQHIFLDAEGKPFLKRVFELDKKAFLLLLDRAQGRYRKDPDGLGPRTRELFEAVRSGPAPARRAAVRAILDLGDEGLGRSLLGVIESLEDEKDRGECLRALGDPAYAWAHPAALKWLDDPSAHLRLCAVVTLEEMAVPEARGPLLRLWEEARDPELRSAILRALGPCGGGATAAAKLLLSQLDERDESVRVAAYLGLGHFLAGERIRKEFAERYPKERRSLAARTALVWGYSRLRDPKLVEDLKALVERERDRRVKLVAAAAERMLRGEPPLAEDSGERERKALEKALSVLEKGDTLRRNRDPLGAPRD